MNPLVSVLIPAYNCEKYIDECLESVVKQTYKNMEIIIWNDGSTDSTYEKCLQWGKKYPFIKVKSDINHGISYVRSKLVWEAQGEWVCSVDSDDTVKQDYVKELVTAAIENDADMCGAYMFDKKKMESFVGETQDFLKHMYNDCVNFTPTCCKVVRTSIERQLSYPLGHIHEDAYVCRERAILCRRIVWLNKQLYNYRNTPNSITKTFSVNRIEDDMTWIKNDIAYYEGKREYDSIVSRARKCLLYKIIYYCRYFGKQQKKEYRKLYMLQLQYIMKDSGTPLKVKIKYWVLWIKLWIS